RPVMPVAASRAAWMGGDRVDRDGRIAAASVDAATSITCGICCPRSADLADRDRLSTLPEAAPPDLAEPVLPAVVGDDRREVVRRELADLRGRRAGPVREEDLALADAARVHRQHAGGGVRGVVLV